MHKFNPDKWQHLESDERRAKLPPEEILQRIGPRSGQVFVDVGAGTGYFAFPAAETRRVLDDFRLGAGG